MAEFGPWKFLNVKCFQGFFGFGSTLSFNSLSDNKMHIVEEEICFIRGNKSVC